MKKILYTFVLAFFLTIAIQGYAAKVNSELCNNVVRLHIIANSDSEFDQKIKFKVRDEILKNISLNDKDFIAKSELISNKVIANCNYNARSEYGKFYFPSKEYNGTSFPAGNYWGVRIILGEGRGQNWWCVLYPPMCVSNENVTMDKYSQDKLKTAVSEDTYNLITERGNKIIVKFKSVELVNKILNLIDIS